MSTYTGSVPQHFVCTHAEARKHIAEHDQFYIWVCGCRASRGGCSHSRMDVCLAFSPEFAHEDQRPRPATREEALEIVVEADTKGLVARPFRNAADPTQLDGICFCCPECCHYFNHPEDPCDKGSLRELTNREQCSDCGACVSVCHFGARELVDGQLVIDGDKCYGCGLCVDACPTGCIAMK
ncbi:MAG: 4Fe-4S binding protein [Chloroflexota bacterium]